MSVSVIGSRGNPPRLSVRSRVSPLVDTRVTTMVLTSLVSCDLSTSNPDVDVATKEEKTYYQLHCLWVLFHSSGRRNINQPKVFQISKKSGQIYVMAIK